MIPARLLPHTVTVRTPTVGTDAYGNTGVSGWGTFTARSITGRMQQQNVEQSEETNGRQGVTAAWLLLTNDLNITPVDRVVWDGDVFEVVGQPARVAGAGPNHHAEVPLRAVV